MVPLETLLSSKYGTSPANITRFNGSRNISIQGSNASGYSSGQAIAAKNAILIVEFAKVRTDKGMDAKKAAVEASGLRLRPIIMTSLAFIIGCLPLTIASGASSAARNSMGTAVVSRMLAATSIGIQTQTARGEGVT